MTKRFFDLMVATTALLLLSPLLLATYLLIRSKLGKPAFFKQRRPGRHSVPFEMLKFRTMQDQVGPDGLLLPDSDRITPLGKSLRASSLDELPELWNVIKGDMSLVGPRPLLMEYVPLYSVTQARRHEVRPGITGWAQVNGRNAISWEERLALDVWYVDNQSLWLDLKILALTVLKVFAQHGISADGEATMPKFQGTKR